ncbi:MAG: hypothetical protein AAF841_09555 [Pseudomonadota bacterium]
MSVPRFAFIALLAFLFMLPLDAQMHIDTTTSGEAWIYPEPQSELAKSVPPFSLPPYWIVQCPVEQRCHARNGPLILVLSESGAPVLHLDPHPKGTVALQISDFAFDAEELLGHALSPLWVSRFSDARAELLIEQEHATGHARALMGFDLALNHLRTRAGVKTGQPPASPLTAHADAADLERTSKPRLVPHTKPQIEFAIRAQDGAFSDDR